MLLGVTHTESCPILPHSATSHTHFVKAAQHF